MNDSILIATKIAADTLPGLYSIGLIANLLSIGIFSRKRFKNTIFETYFRFMSLTDLISLAYPINSYFNFRYDTETYNLSFLLCYYLDYIQFVFPATSAWLLAMISFDRMLNIVFPSKFTIFKKSKLFQYSYCIVALICCMIAYSALLYYREFNTYYSGFNNETNQSNSSYNLCELKPGADSILWIDLFYGNLVPALIMLILNILTISVLFKSRKNSSGGIGKRDVRFAFTSFSLIISFFLLLIFSQLYLILYAYNLIGTDEQNVFWKTLACFAYTIYFSLIFFVNLAINTIFRDEFFKMINEFKRKCKIFYQ
jgi:hypothetical protein